MKIARHREGRARWRCGVSLALLLVGSPARAQSREAAEALGAAVVEGLEAPLRTTIPETWGDRAAVGVRVTGATADAVEAVAGAIARALSSQCHATVLTAGDDAASAAQAARTAGAPRLLRVELSTARGPLRASANLLVVDPGPWRTFLASTDPPPESVATIEREAPSANTAVTPPAPRWPAPGRPRVVATPFRATVALSAVDLDGDAHDELVIVTADRVRVARMSGASLAFVREGPNGSLPRAAVPLRQPLGSADRDAARRIVRYRTSQSSTMGELSLDGAVTRTRALNLDLYPAAGFGCVALRAGSHLVASLSPACDGAVGAPAQGAVAGVPVAYDETRGDEHRRWEVRTNGDGRAEIRRDGAPFTTLDDAASPAALDDLDGDGRAELIVASASAPGAPDRVRVYALGDRAEERASIAVPGSIEAVTTGDLDGDGRRELIVSVLDPTRRTSTLWIVP
ncbi:MAG: VCBS repeat-containing protein [Polyangiales bacterium]